MKKYFLVPALLILSTLACFSTPKDSTNIEILQIPVHEDFHRLQIVANVTVILVSNNNKSITIHGKSKDISKIKIQIKNNQLSIQSRKLLSEHEVKIFIPVSQINDISVDGDALVFSNTFLDAKKLTLALRGNNTVRLNTTAKLIMKSDPDYDITCDPVKSVADASRDHDLKL